VPNKAASKKRSRRGFTLVELLVVLVILGLIATFAAPQVIKFLGGAKSDSARIQIERLITVLDLYRLEVGDYPTTAEGLEALLEAPPDAPNWNGPYLKKADALIDPWGQPYRYTSPGEHGDFDLFTLGKDGSDGGDGEDEDVTSW
jgi:general secretion pathway protein G